MEYGKHNTRMSSLQLKKKKEKKLASTPKYLFGYPFLELL